MCCGSVLASVAAAAQRVGVPVVAGDTKVVPRGAADKLFINTTGIGELVDPATARARRRWKSATS